MEGLIVILLYAFKLAFLASLACVKTKVFSLKSEVKKAYLHAHKRILIMPSIMKEVYGYPTNLITQISKKKCFAPPVCTPEELVASPLRPFL